MIYVQSEDLIRAIRRVRHACERGDAWPILGTIRIALHPVGWLRLVACDNFRIAVADVLITPDEKTPPPYEFEPFNLPSDAITGLLAFLPKSLPIKLTGDGPTLTLEAYGRSLILRGMDGTYPDYTGVIEDVAKVPTTAPVGLNPRFLQEAGGPKIAMRRFYRPSIRLTVGGPGQIVVYADPGDNYAEYIMPVKLTPDWKKETTDGPTA